MMDCGFTILLVEIHPIFLSLYITDSILGFLLLFSINEWIICNRFCISFLFKPPWVAWQFSIDLIWVLGLRISDRNADCFHWLVVGLPYVCQPRKLSCRSVLLWQLARRGFCCLTARQLRCKGFLLHQISSHCICFLKKSLNLHLFTCPKVI